MRQDLPSLNSGKAMAQASHASNLFIYTHGKNKKVKEWQGTLGFGTVIVLGVESLYKLNSIITRTSRDFKLLAGMVVDPTYPYIVANDEIGSLISEDIHTSLRIPRIDNSFVYFRREVTCGFLFEDENLPVSSFISDLKLHP
jgi:hypothetical protein